MTLEDFSLPGTVPAEDPYFKSAMTRKNIELDSIKPIKPKQNNATHEKGNDVAPLSNYVIWDNWVNNTSLHGIRHVFWRRPLWARIGWLLLLLASTGYFLFTAYMSLDKYFKRPINTVITQKYVSNLEFPAVTICPQNLISKKKMYALDGDVDFIRYSLNDNFCSATKSVRGDKPCGAAMVCCCLPLFLMDAEKTVPNCTTPYLQDLIAAQKNSGTSFDTAKFYEKYSQGVEEMLKSGFCVFDGRTDKLCGVSDFSSSVTDWGVCHTFNAGLGGPASIRKARFSGAGWGLILLLNARINDNTIGRLSEGFSVLIHRQGDYFLPWDGITVGPGMQATITLNQQRVSESKNRKLSVVHGNS